ncbi:MAG: hypothetical protein ACOYYU_18965 [Chloroflexota bacterium]
MSAASDGVYLPVSALPSALLGRNINLVTSKWTWFTTVVSALMDNTPTPSATVGRCHRLE